MLLAQWLLCSRVSRKRVSLRMGMPPGHKENAVRGQAECEAAKQVIWYPLSKCCFKLTAIKTLARRSVESLAGTSSVSSLDIEILAKVKFAAFVAHRSKSLTQIWARNAFEEKALEALTQQHYACALHPLSWFSKIPQKGTQYCPSQLSGKQKCDE